MTIHEKNYVTDDYFQKLEKAYFQKLKLLILKNIFSINLV
jgi:hypothetical protein